MAGLQDTLNLTSLTDILLTLIVFFLVLETYGASGGLEVSLPDRDPVKAPDNPNVMVFLPDSRGVVVTAGDNNGVDMPRESLRKYLAALRVRGAFNTVVISAARDLEYKEIVGVMDEARMAGFEKISLDTGSR
jgi:biopolymer transport protein TolR